MRLALLLVVAACAGGHPHYSLSAPPVDAAPLIRLQAFQELRPAYVGSQRICNSRGGCTTQHYYVLGNGTEIWNFEDLAPVIEPTSAAGAAVQEYRDGRRHHATWRNALLAGLVAGLAIAYAGHETDSHTVTVAGFVVAGAAVSFGGFGYLSTGATMNEAKASIYAKYEDGLARRLNICTRGEAKVFVPCDAPFVPLPPDPLLRTLPTR